MLVLPAWVSHSVPLPQAVTIPKVPLLTEMHQCVCVPQNGSDTKRIFFFLSFSVHASVPGEGINIYLVTSQECVFYINLFSSKSTMRSKARTRNDSVLILHVAATQRECLVVKYSH